MNDLPDKFLAEAYRKISLRLVPILFFAYILAYVDRVNVGFAKLAMSKETWFSEAAYATGAGIFFLGYFFFEVPGNLLLHKIGARIWITRIMISWGLVSMLMAWSSSATSFYTLRFLLGVAEAGFFPGIILYLTYWFPRSHRGRVVSWFMTAIAAAGVFGGPLSGAILKASESWAYMKPWQWLFVLEGIPTVVFGVFLPWLLPNGPADAKWLTLVEKNAIQEALGKGNQAANSLISQSWSHGLFQAKVWLMAGVYFGIIMGLYGVSFWLPEIIKSKRTADLWEVGMYSAIPWACACVCMIFAGRSSDRTGRRHLHVTVSALVAALGLGLSTCTGLPFWALLATLAIAISGVMSALGCFWAIPTAFLSGAAAATGIAWINSVGNLAGYLSPELVGWMKKHYGVEAGLWSIAVFLVLSALLLTGIKKWSKDSAYIS